MNETITYFDPFEIQTDPNLQVRSSSAFDDDLTNESESLKAMRNRIRQVVTAGHHVEPIKLIKCDGEYFVFDGHNRLEVYQEIAEKQSLKIPAIVLPYTRKEALAQGYRVNTQHGVAVSLGDSTKAAFRACVYSYNAIQTKDLTQNGLSDSLAQKLRRAAKILIEEAEISEEDSAETIQSKVIAWTGRMAKKYGRADGANTIPRDHLGFPSYRFVLERKTPAKFNEKQRIAQLADKLEKIAQADPDIFLAALKKISRNDRLDLPIRISKRKLDSSDLEF
ncbi:ParB/RepB/Spo0J family partition protein [Pseudoalteromonas xiamenensis]|uniref:ParB-like nuclease domain-containing protein n=1 Tax=Pseudoalteromonas xiamenensis TaxID=882626 RepID=A0A975DHT8_9GAMM|nr:ParB/RepB/Spo0J family partition protein [Pseudoalteromonas xiamenensis]QTH72033.1 ParB-like nuclease domain-containing protein [Pseudoalteromonas xiamenensis]